MGCKTNVIVEKKVCQDNLYDEISKLIAGGMGTNEACKKYVADFNEAHKDEGITVKYWAVKKAYQRANKKALVKVIFLKPLNKTVV